jgi:hypothetical protein
MKSEIGEIRYVTWDKDKDDVLVLDIVILLTESNPDTKMRLVMGHNTEYETWDKCLWKTLDHALAEYPKIQWYSFCSDYPNVKRENHKWKHNE